eukprot:352476-Chlamydomonas_euryale.AAC.29
MRELAGLVREWARVGAICTRMPTGPQPMGTEMQLCCPETEGKPHQPSTPLQHCSLLKTDHDTHSSPSSTQRSEQRWHKWMV